MARVFVSHRGSDATEAEQLADELRKAGHQVRLDVWAVNVGDSINRVHE
jgi:TIR domain